MADNTLGISLLFLAPVAFGVLLLMQPLPALVLFVAGLAFIGAAGVLMGRR